MKRVRCPKCDEFITFDENKYEPGQRLVFVCPACSKQFAIKLGVSKLRKTQKEENEETPQPDAPYGSLTVIENVFHYKQIIPLHLGENAIGRYQKGNPVNCPIETVDPSVDLTHCHINVCGTRTENSSMSCATDRAIQAPSSARNCWGIASDASSTTRHSSRWGRPPLSSTHPSRVCLLLLAEYGKTT